MYLQETDEVTRLYCTICLMNHLMSSTSFHSSFLSFILFPFILSGSIFPPTILFLYFSFFLQTIHSFFPLFSILALIFNFILYLYPCSPSCFSLSLLSFFFLFVLHSLIVFVSFLFTQSPSLLSFPVLFCLHPCSPFLFCPYLYLCSLFLFFFPQPPSLLSFLFSLFYFLFFSLSFYSCSPVTFFPVNHCSLFLFLPPCSLFFILFSLLSPFLLSFPFLSHPLFLPVSIRLPFSLLFFSPSLLSFFFHYFNCCSSSLYSISYSLYLPPSLPPSLYLFYFHLLFLCCVTPHLLLIYFVPFPPHSFHSLFLNSFSLPLNLHSLFYSQLPLTALNPIHQPMYPMIPLHFAY